MQVVKYNIKSGKLTVLTDKFPSGGWHEPGGPLFSSDGLMYFGNGSVSQQGVVLPAGFTVDIAKHPLAHDVPGQDVTLTSTDQLLLQECTLEMCSISILYKKSF